MFDDSCLLDHVSKDTDVLVTFGMYNPEGVFGAYVDKGYVSWFTIDENNNRDHYQMDKYISFKLTDDAKDLLRFNLL